MYVLDNNDNVYLIFENVILECRVLALLVCYLLVISRTDN